MVATALSVQRFWSGKPLTLFDKAIKIPTCRFMMIALRTLAGTALLDMPDPGWRTIHISQDPHATCNKGSIVDDQLPLVLRWR
jgi:hypothetical protein